MLFGAACISGTCCSRATTDAMGSHWTPQSTLDSLGLRWMHWSTLDP